MMKTPDGYVLVPVEPTSKMLDAVEAGTVQNASLTDAIRRHNHYKEIYSRMIAAAPLAPAAQDVNAELLEALKEATDLLEAAVMGDRVNTSRIDRVLERTEIAKAEAQKAGE